MVEPAAADIAEAVARIVCDAQASARMREAAAAFAQQEYSPQVMGARLKALYADILGA